MFIFAFQVIHSGAGVICVRRWNADSVVDDVDDDNDAFAVRRQSYNTVRR